MMGRQLKKNGSVGHDYYELFHWILLMLTILEPTYQLSLKQCLVTTSSTASNKIVMRDSLNFGDNVTYV